MRQAKEARIRKMCLVSPYLMFPSTDHTLILLLLELIDDSVSLASPREEMIVLRSFVYDRNNKVASVGTDLSPNSLDSLDENRKPIRNNPAV